MSLEATIAENTAAIRELIAKLSAGAVIDHAQAHTDKTAAGTTAKKSDKAPSSEPTPNASASSASSSNEATKSDAGAKPGATDKAEPTYQDAASAITRLSKAHGRDAAVNLLKAFNAKTLKDVAPEEFAALISQADKAMEAVEA